MIEKVKANLVFSLDFKSFFKSCWIGPLLITWCMDDVSRVWYKTIEFSWYGFNYWQPQEVEWSDKDDLL